MITRRPPILRLNGRDLTGFAADRAPVLGDVELVWGTEDPTIAADPATLTFKILFLDTMEDIPDLSKGAVVELVDPPSGYGIFAGLVTTMSAAPHPKFPGSLEVTVSCADWASEGDQVYISPDWPQGQSRTWYLHEAANAAGYTLELPPDPDARDSAALKVNSIKLFTALDRFTSRYRGFRFDTSYRNGAGGALIKRLRVIPGRTRTMSPDKLTATPKWNRQRTAPTLDGEVSPMLVIPASNILNTPSWSIGREDTTTAVKLSATVPGENGMTELEERNYYAPQAIRDQFGINSVDIETDVLDPAQWANVAAGYFEDSAPWRMNAVTIRDTDLLTDEQMTQLFYTRDRYSTLTIIEGIAPNRPDPGPSDLRSYLSGGTYHWDGKKWQIELTLERTITGLEGEGDWWTAERVAASTNTNISNATALTVGDALTAADFRFIGAP